MFLFALDYIPVLVWLYGYLCSLLFRFSLAILCLAGPTPLHKSPPAPPSPREGTMLRPPVPPPHPMAAAGNLGKMWAIYVRSLWLVSFLLLLLQLFPPFDQSPPSPSGETTSETGTSSASAPETMKMSYFQQQLQSGGSKASHHSSFLADAVRFAAQTALQIALPPLRDITTKRKGSKMDYTSLDTSPSQLDYECIGLIMRSLKFHFLFRH